MLGSEAKGERRGEWRVIVIILVLLQNDSLLSLLCLLRSLCNLVPHNLSDRSRCHWSILHDLIPHFTLTFLQIGGHTCRNIERYRLLGHCIIGGPSDLRWVRCIAVRVVILDCIRPIIAKCICHRLITCRESMNQRRPERTREAEQGEKAGR